MEPVPIVPQPRRPGAVPVSGVLSPAGTVPVVTVFIQLSTPTPNKVQQHINLTASVTIYLSNLTFFVAFKCRELLKLNKLFINPLGLAGECIVSKLATLFLTP